MNDAKAAIHELFKKIKDIKSKAEQSEVMVQEICGDIKQLDWAKKHLTATISALKRLQMLVTAIDRLTDMAGKREYREAAELMGAVNQLSKHFDAYSKVLTGRCTFPLKVHVLTSLIFITSCNLACLYALKHRFLK